jgi:hypothetical protein
VDNNSAFGTTYVTWYDCDRVFQTGVLYPQTSFAICACNGTVTANGGDPVVTDLGTCGPPPSPTPTPTPTPSCTTRGWLISTCDSTCTLGICTCTFAGNLVVYTNCSVTDITDVTTSIFTDSTLTTPYTGNFSYGGSIWESIAGTVQLVCVIGGPC